MSSSFKFLGFASLVAAVAANPVFHNLVLHEKREGAPNGFIKLGAAPADQVLNLRLALVNSDMPGLESSLYAVSTPGSALYGQHLTKEAVEEFVKPAPESVSIVNEFFAAQNVTAKSISPAGDWLAFSVPVSKANEIFGANFSVFQHEETGKQSVRTLAYSIPAALKGHIDLVHPTITFSNSLAHLPLVSSPVSAVAGVQNLRSRANVPSSCDSTITPKCLQALYGIPTTLATESSNTLSVPGFVEEYANHADLTSFLKTHRPDLSANTTFQLQTLNGGSNSQNASEAGPEANLDIQYTVGLASGVPTTFISVGGNITSDGFGNLLDIMANFVLGESNPPHVLSTSYGLNEDDVPPALANKICNTFMQLGARGTTVVFGSGDGGVGGLQLGNTTCSAFVPTFPAGCPFITSVGATTLIKETETAANFTTGGFSNYFGMPSYQASAVSSFLAAQGSTNNGRFNTSGRAFPDVAAQGVNVEIVVGGKTQTIWGTSCAGPIFASVIALLNDRLIAAGKAPLGFLNPLLYSATGKAALNDVTSGNNPGCGTSGFTARTGWDPITGLGTPNFPALMGAVGLETPN
ncbi:family S53 protease-like protein [Phellopilus nigrolimitatus]|nr:family S53 protease-like protein [Phellopilus nigrolimitatus]